MFQEEEDSLEAAMERGRLGGDLHREEEEEKEEEGEEGEADARGLTRSALGPAVGKTSSTFHKTYN